MSKNQNNQAQQPAPLNNAQFAQQQAQFPQFQQQQQAIPNQPNQSSFGGNNPFGQMPAYPQQQNANINLMMNQQQLPQQQYKQFPIQQQQSQIPQQMYSQQQQHQQIPLFGSNYQQPQALFGGPTLNINYNDDEEIHPMEKKNDADQQAIYDLIGNLEFSINAQYQMGKLKKDQIQYLPAMVTLKTKEEEVKNNAKEAPKVGVDLICIIDRSGSMQGQKIQMVKQTLKLLLNFLTEKDRLCLIQFDNEAQRLTTLQKVSAQNKIKIEKTIDSIQANGGTTIATGTHIAFEQIKQRKYRNNVTSIFMLSDGQDGSAEQSVQAQLTQFDEPFTIHSFGFGQDHDAKLMTSLCNLKNGSFYFVNDISLLDEFFIDALGGLVSVVGEKIEISVKLTTLAPFDGIQISKTYGKMWQKVNERNYKVNIPQIASGSRKDYVFELSLPKFEAQIGDEQRVASVINAIVTIKSAQTGQLITKQATLDLTFFNENEQLPANEENIDVAAQYYRVKGADVIDDARRACEQNQYQNAQVMLDTMIANINRNQKVAKASEGIIQDLVQAKQATQPQNFNRFGQQQMCQMSSNNYAQAGINANFNAKGIQQQQMQPASYQNLCQANWVGQVQKSKRQS